MNILLSKLSIVIKSQFSICRVNLATGSLCQRIDLKLEAVDLDKHVVKPSDLFSTLTSQLAFKFQKVSDLIANIIRDSVDNVDRDFLNPIRSLFGHLLNVDATVRRADNHRAIVLAVHEDAKVRLTGNVNGLGHHDLAHRDALGRSLLGDQTMADHAADKIRNFSRILSEMDTSLQKYVNHKF